LFLRTRLLLKEGTPQMLRSRIGKGPLNSTHRVFTRVSLVLILLAMSGLGLATISVSSHSDRSTPKLTEPAARVELRGDSTHQFRLRGLRDANGSPAFSHGAGASTLIPAPFATSIDVDRTDDVAAASACTAAASDCSLRGAVQYANNNPGTTINIPAGTYNLSIAGGAGEGFSGNNAIGDLDVTASNTTIAGAGAGTTIIHQTTANDRVIEANPFLDPNFNFTVSDVTVTGGKETTAVGGGGLIAGSQGSNTNIINCVFTSNSATGAGTAGGGGASVLGGNLNITNSTFQSNSTSASGGAVGYSSGDPFGRPSSGTLTVTGSTFSGNSAASVPAGGGALDLFDFNLSVSAYQVSSSSFSGNNTVNGSGGAILVETGPLTLTTSSLSNNHAKNFGGAIRSDSSLSVSYSRLVGNSSDTPSKGNSLFGHGGQLSADNNWWGSSDGPSVNDVRIQGPSNTTSAQIVNDWLVLRHSANPASVCANQPTTLTADIKGRHSGSALTTELNGLPAFPVPGTTIFSNPQLGTISGASTQFVNGVATATFTAGSTTGTGSADASVDAQTPPVTAEIIIDHNTTSDPADQNVCEGATATFTTTASGNGPFTFVWKRGATVLGNGGNISINSSSNTSTLSISNAQASDADTYTVEMNGACNSDTKSATLTVNQPTSATVPADETVCQGASASFSTTASGTGPFTSQWKLDGNDISGANGSSVSVNTSSLSVGNHSVSVAVSGACGSVTKSATLTVQETTTATVPNDQTVCQGANASFSTTASGTGPFHYAWTVDGNAVGGDSASVSIQTGSLSIGNHTASVVVSGACGSVTKSATLTVQETTTATVPNDQTVCQGANASFSTTASGTGPFHYAWTVDGSPAGSDASSLSVSTGSLSLGSHTVSVTVNGTCGSVTKSATLTVQENTSATAPADETVCQGANASFSTTASGTGPFHYAWTVDGNAVGGDSASVSVATTMLSVGNHTVALTVSGACGSVTKSATLTVQETTTATVPNDQTVCQGANASFSTTASGTGPFHYTWTVDGNAVGGDSASVSIQTGSLSGGSHQVAVTVSGTCGSVTRTATLNVNTSPIVTTNPASQQVISGNATFTAAASGTPAPTVQWQVSTNGGASFTNISGATSTTLTFAVNSSMNGNQYRAVFTNACGTATTSAATLTTCSPPMVTANPASVADACVGQVVNFTASAGGTPAPTVQWQVSTNGGASFTNISGATSNTLSVTASVAVRNNKYRAVFTNACGTDTSSAATLGVDTIAPTITLSKTTMSLWPPDHKYETINLSDFVSGASDNCGGNLLGSVVIASVTSDEVEDNPNGGDGATLNDIVIAPNCKSVQLRAERDGNLNGRVYTITFRVTDSAGNVRTATATVTVPHSQNNGSAVNDGPHYTVNGTCP
jgi:predicted outer membrane repeat protein